ncbi:ATP-binding cassette domain-containing protein [Actinosynnema sp. NPDC020468]|uniref:ABC transporter ATP-binding protein n=1 Tax=Actinosynnema sp. NPDC020468 TaxID=3154488 RepID=UPI0033D97BE9
MTPVVRVENLGATVDGHVLLDGVGFTVDAGRVVALVGASGSGKTTTGLALLGEGPATGSVTVRGRVGFVPQQPSAALNPVRRVGAVFREIADRHPGDPRDLIATALRRARVPADLLHRYPHQLSGGQQQRVVLAQALIGDPAVLVADEPTTGQDPLTRTEVVDELSAVVAQGTAVVLLTHDLDVVRALADHIVVLRAGRVVEQGPADALFTHPEHPYTAALLAATPPHPTPPTTDAPRLRVRGLTAHHRSTTVLRDITLDVTERLAVIGRSGSGKTTLGRCLAGLHEPSAGEVLLHGTPLPRSLRRRTPAQLAAVQYVFQDARASFDTRRPVLDQVARTAVRLRGLAESDARAEALAELAAVGVTGETAARRPHALSGGELQRAALVRALLARPEVLICDEVTSGLDTVTRADLLAVLATVPCALVLISHDPQVVARFADRVTVLHEGRVVSHGPASTAIEGAKEKMT